MRGNHVTIIGAGPGGLASAILLAGAGLQVTVLERLPRVGGRTSTLEADGFRFDLGPTFFLYPAILREIFASVGHDLDREVELVRLDPQYRLVFGGGGELLATPDVERMEQAVAGLSPRDAPAFRRFLDDNRRRFELFRPCLQSPFQSWSDVLSSRILKLLPEIKPWRSLDAELGRYFSDPRLRLAFSFQSKYLGMSPFRCPSLFSILSFLEYEHGVFHRSATGSPKRPASWPGPCPLRRAGARPRCSPRRSSPWPTPAGSWNGRRRASSRPAASAAKAGRPGSAGWTSRSGASPWAWS